KCYSIVWCASRNMYVVASEFSRGHRRACAAVAGMILSAIGLITQTVAAEERGPLSGATVNMNNGDTITLSSGGTAIDSTTSGGEGVQIDGQATIAVSGDSGSVGINLDNGATNYLGDGTQIHIADSGTTTSNATYGIYIAGVTPETNISANNLLIDVVNKNSAYGIYDRGTNNTLDLGQGSTINVTSDAGNATGIYFNDDDNTLIMDNGLIDVTANSTGKAFGIDTYGTDGATLDLGNNTQLTLTSGSGGGSALNLGSGTMLTANGLAIDFTAPAATSSTSIYGIQLQRGTNVNLGENSSITLSSSGGTEYGLVSGQGSTFKADALDINLTNTSTNTASGQGAQVIGSVDLGKDSTISVHGFSSGYGITVQDYAATSKGNVTATVTADNLTVDVTGDKTEGIRIEGGIVNLGSGSSVSADGLASTIYLTGRAYGELDADNLTVTTSRGTAISLVSNMADTVVNIGEGSIVDGRNDAGSATSGIIANTPYQAKATVNFNGSAEQRNTIYAVSGYGASAQFSGSTINLSNTDIIMSGVSPYGLWAVGDNSFSSAGVINADNVTIDMTNTNSGAGIMVQQGGIVNLSGDTTIKTADNGTAIWVPKVTSGNYVLPGGTVTGTGKMMITGNIVNSGWGYINLSMDAGSLFEGKTSVNTAFNSQGIDSVIDLTLADNAKWFVTDDSTLTTLDNAGTVELASDSTAGSWSTLHADVITLQKSSQLSVDLSAAALASDAAAPLITGGQVTLGGDLHIADTGNAMNLAAITSDEQLAEAGKITLIDADSAITGNFDTLSSDTATLPDYIAFTGEVNAADDTQYQLGFGLSWYAGSSAAVSTPAHGTFTLDEGQSFTVNQVLQDVAPDATTGWNGSTLTKDGDGTLILTAENTYSGGTLINAGQLIADNAWSLGTGDITNNATLQLSEGTLSGAMSGTGRLIKTGEGTLTLNDNNSWSGGTQIEEGTVAANNASALGTGDISNDGVLQLNEGDLTVAVSGAGSLHKTGDTQLTLSGDNSYTGGTVIDSGTLEATRATALGYGDVDNAGVLILDAQDEFQLQNVTTRESGTTSIASGTTLNAESLTQSSGSTLNIALDSASDSPIITAGDVNLDGTLNITGFGSIEDQLVTPPHSFTLIDADSAINGNFDTLTVAGMSADSVDFITVNGRVNATDNTQYDLTAGLSWYADSYLSVTPAHGTFTLSEADQNFTLSTALVDVAPNAATNWDGKSLTKKGAGALTLTANNTYSGTTEIQEGTLWLTETGIIGAENSQQSVNVSAAATLGGEGTINGNVSNSGTVRFGDLTTVNSDFTINGNLTNQGGIISSGTTPGNKLVINGDYQGQDGELTLNTYLGDDSSPTDQMVVSGDVSGSTTLYINQAGGEGALTSQGIEVVDVGGTSTDNAFTLGNQVQIGAYEYRLYEDNESWYLRSQADTPVDPDDGGDVTPVDPDDGGDVTPVNPDDGGDVTPVPPDDGGDVTPVNPDDGGDVTPVNPDDGGDVTPVPPDDGGDVTPSNPQYRADIGAYLGNQWLARSLQMQTLYDREGSQYRSAEGSLWARFKGGNTDTSAVGGKVDIDSDYFQFQLGSDIAAWNNGQQSLTLGVMASYINGNTDSTGNRGADGSQFTASGDVDGYNLGLYATWFADALQHRGWYVDSWYQYGFYDNSVDNGTVGSTNYDSHANAVSLESGYRYDINLSSGNSVSLTPQAQVVWQNYQADRVEANGTRIDGQNGDNWTTRLGLRMDGKFKAAGSAIQPFAEINWLHTTDDLSVSFDGTRLQQDLPTDRAELKLGLQANIGSQWSIRAQAVGQKGDQDYRDISGSLNLRYSW
ncbi:autotransporter outer membrane beta-barrel domain-containing protein, partial [Salmonella enterica subsp. salamae]|nr:autotransporter outer membrane beta-barrel domain-containing protein [Salmonella enterica subsp. salamae]